jgi:hypothetical protein
LTKYLPLVVLIIIVGACNLSGKQVILKQRLQSGRTYHYTVQKTLTTDSGSLHAKTTSRTDVSLSVGNHKQGSTECTWTYGKTTPVGVNPELLDEKTKQHLNYNCGLTVKFLVNDQGCFKSLTNLSDCQAFLENAYAKIFGDLASKKKVDEVMEAIVRPMYRTDNNFLITYCQEISAMFGVVGDTLFIGKPKKTEQYVMMPVVDTAIKLVIIEKLKTIKRGKAFVSFEQRLAPESNQALLASTGKIASKPTPLDDASDDDFNLEYLVTGSFIYNIDQQLITKFNSRKEARIDYKTKVEVVDIVLDN